MTNMVIDNIETLHALLDHINIGVTVLDENNQVLFWNQFMAKHSGITAADLVGKNIFTVFSYLPRQWMEFKT